MKPAEPEKKERFYSRLKRWLYSEETDEHVRSVRYTAIPEAGSAFVLYFYFPDLVPPGWLYSVYILAAVRLMIPYILDIKGINEEQRILTGRISLISVTASGLLWGLWISGALPAVSHFPWTGGLILFLAALWIYRSLLPVHTVAYTMPMVAASAWISAEAGDVRLSAIIVIIYIIVLETMRRHTDLRRQLMETSDQSLWESIDRMNSEREILEAKDRAEEATKLKDRYISLVTHDLRSPVSGIAGMLSLMEQEIEAGNADTDRLLKMTRQLRKSAEGMKETIDQLLDISRFQTGQVTLSKSLLNISELLEKAVTDSLIRFRCSEKNIRFLVTCDSGLQHSADGHLLAEVIKNLLTNAVKFTDAEGSIFLRAYREDGLIIEVEDTGRGIPAKTVPELFRHEIRTTTTGTMGEKGTGLGLPYSYDIVKAHGGTISVQSEAGVKTVFTVLIP